MVVAFIVFHEDRGEGEEGTRTTIDHSLLDKVKTRDGSATVKTAAFIVPVLESDKTLSSSTQENSSDDEAMHSLGLSFTDKVQGRIDPTAESNVAKINSE